jgi:hypothetical protein
MTVRMAACSSAVVLSARARRRMKGPGFCGGSRVPWGGSGQLQSRSPSFVPAVRLVGWGLLVGTARCSRWMRSGI